MDKQKGENTPCELLDRSPNSYMRRIFSFFYNVIFVVLLQAIYILAALIVSVIIGFALPGSPQTVFRILFVADPLVILLILSRFTAQARQTPGNKSMGLVIVHDNGVPLAYVESVARNFLLILFALPLGAGLIWALFDVQGKGLHDRVMSTRLGNAPGAEGLKIPVFPFIVFVLSITCLLLFIPPFAVLIEAWPSSNMLLAPLFLLFFLTPVTLVLSLVGKWISRKNEIAKKITKTTTSISVMALVGVILFAIIIPSNNFLQVVSRTRQCETDLMEIGTAMDDYVREHGRYPETLDDLLYAGHISAVPRFMNSEPYLYAVGFMNDDTVFIIMCPHPRRLLKDQGFLPARQVTDMNYIQGKGLVTVIQ